MVVIASYWSYASYECQIENDAGESITTRRGLFPISL